MSGTSLSIVAFHGDTYYTYSHYTGCNQAYKSEEQQHACSVGCQTPTIDSMFSNRSHIYSEDTNVTMEADIVLSFPGSSLFSGVVQFFFPQSDTANFDDLNQHAETLDIMMIPYRRTDITVLTADVSHSNLFFPKLRLCYCV